jgi:hypothetical protein
MKKEVMDYVKYLIEDFPLNAKFIYEEAFLVVENNAKVNFVVYIVKDIGDAYRSMEEGR